MIVFSFVEMQINPCCALDSLISPRSHRDNMFMFNMFSKERADGPRLPHVDEREAGAGVRALRRRAGLLPRHPQRDGRRRRRLRLLHRQLTHGHGQDAQIQLRGLGSGDAQNR